MNFQYEALYFIVFRVNVNSNLSLRGRQMYPGLGGLIFHGQLLTINSKY